MKKWTRVFLCAAVVVLAASGCKKEEVQESTETPTETSTPAETETPTMAELPEASVTLGEYKGIVVEDPYVEITDEDIEARITQVLAANPKQTEVDRPAENGDVVNIDYVGMKDGVPFDRGADDNYDLVLGSHSFIDGFEDGLVGAKTGDELSLNLTFPENYGNAELAGQDVVFDVTVNAVKEQSEAELNDEFVKKYSNESETVEEYRAELRKMMEEQARAEADMQIQNAVVDKVVENATFTGLEERVEAEFAQELASMESALGEQGATLAEYAQMYAMDEDTMKEQLRAQVQGVNEINLIADAVAEAEGLKADDASRQRLAELNGVESVIDLVTQYGQEAVDNAAKRILVMDFLVDNAKVE